MKQIKYLSFIPFLALLCLMTGCENDKDVYYPYVNVPLTTHLSLIHISEPTRP